MLKDLIKIADKLCSLCLKKEKVSDNGFILDYCKYT